MASVSSMEPTRVGFIVAKTVGNAVVRNRVKRRLREILADILRNCPTGLTIVVRALPASAESDFDLLRLEATSAFSRSLDRLASLASRAVEEKGTGHGHI